MPIYEFRCQSCGELFERLVAPGTESAVCDACGSERSLRVYSTPSPPFHVVQSAGERRKQERRNTQLRERAKADFKRGRERARRARPGNGAR